MSETAPEFTPRPPGNGPMGIDTKWWIIGGVVAAGVVYYVYKRSATGTPSSAGTAGSDPNAIDPTTGIPYADEYGGSPYGTSSYSPVYGTGSATPVQTSTTVNVKTPLPMTNRQWYDIAVSALAHHGVHRAHARQVLGEYLLRIPLTTDEVRIVEKATQLVGPPPNPVPIQHVPNHRKH